MNSETFYQNILQKALLEIKQEKANAMVFGPLKPQSLDFTENLNSFHEAQQIVQHQGYKVFDQIPYLDIYLSDAPFDFDIKFPIFFQGIIQSKLITHAFFTSDWKTSIGATKEHEYCEKSDIKIMYL